MKTLITKGLVVKSSCPAKYVFVILAVTVITSKFPCSFAKCNFSSLFLYLFCLAF